LIEIYLICLVRTAQENVSNLNNIVKKFEEDKDILIAEELNILKFPPKSSLRTPRTAWITESPRTSQTINPNKIDMIADIKPIPPQNPTKKVPIRSRFKALGRGKNPSQ